MSNIEQIIKDNREVFNGTLPKGHAQRFRKQLRQQPSVQRQRKYFYISASLIAAAVTALLIVIPLFYEQNSNEILSAELQDVDMYYRAKLNKQTDILRPLLSKLDVYSRKEVENDLLSAQDLLPESSVWTVMSEEQKIMCMVESYTMRISSIEQMTELLQQIK